MTLPALAIPGATIALQAAVLRGVGRVASDATNVVEEVVAP